MMETESAVAAATTTTTADNPEEGRADDLPVDVGQPEDLIVRGRLFPPMPFPFRPTLLAARRGGPPRPLMSALELVRPAPRRGRHSMPPPRQPAPIRSAPPLGTPLLHHDPSQRARTMGRFYGLLALLSDAQIDHVIPVMVDLIHAMKLYPHDE